jgi:ketosteroid isomerase-like protein
MSRENVEIVRRALEAFERGGLEATLAFYDPDVTWIVAEDEPEAATLRGHDGLRALAQQWLEAFDELHIDPKEFIDAGEVAVVPYRFRARERSSGSEITAPETWVFWLRDRMIVEVREYRRKAEALTALGLSEQDARAET